MIEVGLGVEPGVAEVVEVRTRVVGVESSGTVTLQGIQLAIPPKYEREKLAQKTKIRILRSYHSSTSVQIVSSLS